MPPAPKPSSWCTPLLPVAAEAAEQHREEIYPVHLTPGRSYPILDFGEDSLILGSPDHYPIAFFVRIDEPGHWSRFRFTDEPLPWSGTVPVSVPPTTPLTD